ncbi:hypothetical protein THAOC_33136, partial [Thalassiosira oceanica]
MEVAGGTKHGNCNHPLGNATVEFTIDGCDPTYYKQTSVQTSVSATYQVPAHKINARLTNLKSNSGDRTEILKKLRTIVNTINLKNIGEVDEHTKQPQDGSDLNQDVSQAAEATAELQASEEGVKTIRFQYDGILTFRPTIAAVAGGEQIDSAKDCHPYEMDFPVSSKSFHVLDYNTVFKLRVQLLQLIIPEEDVVCAIVDHGGDSAVIYNRIETTVKLSSESHEKYMGHSFEFGAGPKIESDSDIAIGLGMAPGPEVKSGVLKGDATPALGYIEHSVNSLQEEENSAGFTMTWSYTTAGQEGAKNGQGFAGQESDVFLLPTFSIIYRPISFFTWHHVTTELQPNLNKQLKQLQDERATLNDSTEDIDNQIKAVKASIEGWKEILADYDKTNQQGEWHAANWANWERVIKSNDGDNSIIRKEYNCATETKPYIYEVCNFFDSDWLCLSDKDRKIEDGKWEKEDWQDLPSSHPYYALWDFKNPNPGSANTLKDQTIPGFETYTPEADFTELEEGDNLLSPRMFQDREENLEAFKNYLASSGNGGQAGNGDINYNKNAETIQFSGGGGELYFEFEAERVNSMQTMFQNPAKGGRENNEDTSTGGGIRSHVDLEVGYLAMVGVEVESDINFGNIEVSHRMVQSSEAESSSSIEVHFGDREFDLSRPQGLIFLQPHRVRPWLLLYKYPADFGDEFMVDMYLDSKYGSFVFVTVGGQSKCPHEVGTSAVEDPSIKIVESTRQPIVADDEVMYFDVEIANIGYGESFFYVYTDLLDNREGLTLSMDGDALNSPSTWKLKGTEIGGQSTLSTLTVEKGPRWNVDRTDQPRCEFEEEAGRQINSDLIWNVAREANDGEATIERYIEFTRPCPEIEFEGDLKRFDTFTTNRLSMNVKIRNPLRFRDIKLAEQERLKKIVLEYRKVSGRLPNWNRAKDIETNTELNFNAMQEDSFGYISATWKLPSIDAWYDIRLRAICTEEPAAPVRLNRFISDTVTGVIDRTAPAVFGVPQPSVNLFPGDKLAVEFTEDIECELPYLFTVKIEVSELDVLFIKDRSDRDDLHVICLENTIFIQFNEERVPTKSFARLMGRTYELTVADVVDPAGNKIEPYTYQSNFVCSPPNPGLTITSFQDNIYLPYQAIRFSAVISNNEKYPSQNVDEQWSKTYLELGLEAKSNTEDLTVHVNGEPLVEPQEYILEGREHVTTHVEIRKTSTGKKLRFDPINLFLRSSCMGDEENPITVTATAFNHVDDDGTKSIMFTPPCPAIQWAGSMAKERRFLFGINTLDHLKMHIDLSIFNLDYVNRQLFDRSVLNDNIPSEEKRLERVALLYRRSRDMGPWNIGLLPSGQPMDFSVQGLENELGHVKLQWDVSGIGDSQYEIKVQSVCTDLGGSPDNEFYDTDTIELILDQDPPSIFSKPQVKLIGSIDKVQDEEFGLSFTEPLFCNEPYTFGLNVTLSIDETDKALSHGNGIKVICEGKMIRYRFEHQALEGFPTNTSVTFALDGVQDLAGNCVSTQHAERQNLGCDGVDNDCDGEVDECGEDQFPPEISFEDGLAVDASRNAEGLVMINTPTFSSLVDAQSYLAGILVAKDDCMGDLQLSVTPPTLGSSCRSTIFEVTATSNQCPDQTVTRQYQMTVDTDVPVVTAGFNLGQGHVNDFNSVGDEGVYLGIASSNATDYEYVGFSYTVKDDCLQTLQIHVEVSSNEFEYDNSKASDSMVLIRNTKDPRQSHSLMVFVEPRQCGVISDQLCVRNSNVGFRYYQFDVEATDLAGNTGSATAYVVVVPK